MRRAGSRLPLWVPADDCDPAAVKKSGPQTKAKADPEPLDKAGKFQQACNDAWNALAVLGPASKSRWGQSAGINSQRINAIVETLLQAKRITPCQVETGGGTYDGFEVIKAGSDGSDTSDKPT